MMICKTHWVGRPTIRQKVVYNASYALCFFAIVNSLTLALIVSAAQIASVLITGKTTHGLLANMNSERA